MQLLTIAEIAKRLDLPESTVRYYRDMFESFVPSHGSGRGRRYTEDALDVLRFVADAMRSGVPKEEIQEALQQRFPMTVDTQQEAAATQQQGAAIMRQFVADAVQDLLREQAAAYEARIDELERRLEAREKRAEERDAILLHTLREIQASKHKPSLFRRIFGGKRE